MNEDQLTYMLIKGAIADLPEADRQGVEIAAAKIKAVVEEHNDHGKLALSLVAAKLAAEE